MRKQINTIGLTILLVSFISNFAIGQQDANGFHGYKIGHYEGDVVNTTANTKGKAVCEIKSINRATGDVSAHFVASDGLFGEADLTGKIDESGIMKLSGTLANWEMGVVGRLNGNTIKAGYRLTSKSNPQEGTFTVNIEPTTSEKGDAVFAAKRR